MPGVIADKLDPMDPSSIDAFANRFVGSGQPLHILVNNAGIMANPLTRDACGYEFGRTTDRRRVSKLTPGRCSRNRSLIFRYRVFRLFVGQVLSMDNLLRKREIRECKTEQD